MGEQHFLKEISQYRVELTKLVNGRNVLEFGCGTGVLTQLLLDAGARKVVGYEIDPTLCKVADPRFDLRVADYTATYNWPSEGYCFVSNAAYSTLPFIVDSVLPFILDAIVMVPGSRVDEFKGLGFRKLFGLDGNAFDPPAEGEHYVMARGFQPRFVDLHYVCGTVTESHVIGERVRQLANKLPSAAICGIGGIPIRLVDGAPHWCDKPITANVLREHIVDALGLSAILTYTNKNQRSIQSLGEICANRDETWAYHWITLTMVLANQPPEVQLAFARDGRFKLGWTVEKQYTGSVFMASAGLHEWIKFTSKWNDSSFDNATRDAMHNCFNVLKDVLP